MVNNEFQEEPEQFKQFLRMSEESFTKLLDRIQPQIEKSNTKFRDAISARNKLIVTLRFLATGETYRSLMYAFRIAESTISLFIPEVCATIYEALKDDYLKVKFCIHILVSNYLNMLLLLQTPTTAAEWLNIAQEFEKTWNIPNVIGALDGKHIVFRPSKSDGSIYYNYKNTHSIVLLALVDANYNFTYIDVGVNGRVSDGGVYRQSSLAKAIAQNSINIPEDRSLPGRNKLVPHVILADAAFPLSEHILKPYPFRDMSDEQRIFNYRLSRGRRVVENAFGILANRFRIFLTTINLRVEKVQGITLACCVLHNFLRAENPSKIQVEDIEKSYVFKWGLSHQSGNRAKESCLSVRDEFKQYFVNEGTVPWQIEILK